MSVKSDPAGWSDPRHREGVAGEHLAAAYLAANGYYVLDHRFRLGRLEIDLVVQKGSLVVFVEVKTRRCAAFGGPTEAITWSKKLEIERVARAWITGRGSSHMTYRFDVVGVTLHSGGARIEHVEDAFRSGWR